MNRKGEIAVDDHQQGKIPEVALRWIIHHTVSNVELARLSNVCMFWRITVQEIVVQMALMNCTDIYEESSLFNSRNQSLLLLPSMIRELVRSSLVDNDSGILYREREKQSETFCAIWLDPSGIKLESNGECSEIDKNLATATKGIESRKRDHSNKDADDVDVLMVKEWRGYRFPTQVLRSFGYESAFVDSVFKTALDRIQKLFSVIFSITLQEHYGLDISNYYRPSIAVRGATVARPEGYCLCYDAEIDDVFRQQQKIQKASEPTLSQTQRHPTYGAEIRDDDVDLSQIELATHRQQLQQEVLPCRILSSAMKNLYEPVNKANSHSTGSQHCQQPSVQFLNSSSCHAVCMMTPAFACGPLAEPITIFCVAIATEDGCFLSGLHRRFELGHLYPSSNALEELEKSSICLATEFDSPSEARFSALPQCSRGGDVEESENMEGDQHPRCRCIFRGTVPKIEEIDTEPPARLIRGRIGPGAWHCYTVIVDGWNSQVRIDGKAEPVQYTMLEEGAAAVTFSTPSSATPKTTANSVHQNQQALPNPGTSKLDGLTIGSDHCFGMSLCSGQGSDGEGEGAISEVVVFQGHLNDLDIQELESQFLAKHGLTKLDESKSSMHEMDRLAEAMIILPPSPILPTPLLPSTIPLDRIPLRFLTRHKSVAWKWRNPVDGRPGLVSRIGVKHDDCSSSDWS